MNVKIADVRVPAKRRRALDQGSVNALVESIREVGLLNPITVTKDMRLVSGLHRKEACEQLGWTEIPAVIIDLDGLKAELAEIDENLVRNELTALERSDHYIRRKEIYESLHPETRHINERGGGPGRGNKTDPESGSVSVAAFVDDTAAKTGRSRSVIAEEVKIGRDLAPDVKDSLRGTAIADNKTALLALATEPAARQRELVAAGPEAIKEAAKAQHKRPSMRLSAEDRRHVEATLAAAPPPSSEPKVDLSTLPDPTARLATLVARIDHALHAASGAAALALVRAARDVAVATGSGIEPAEARYRSKVHGLVDISSSRRSNRRDSAIPRSEQ